MKKLVIISIIVILVSNYVFSQPGKYDHLNVGDTAYTNYWGYPVIMNLDRITRVKVQKNKVVEISLNKAKKLITDFDKNGVGYKLLVFEYPGTYSQWIDIDKEIYLMHLNNIKSDKHPFWNARPNIGFVPTMKYSYSSTSHGKQNETIYVINEGTSEGNTIFGILTDKFALGQYFTKKVKKTKERRDYEREIDNSGIRAEKGYSKEPITIIEAY